MNQGVIQLLIDLADQKSKAAAVALASALRNEQSTREKASTLYQFAGQYEHNLTKKSQDGMSMSEMRNTRQFINNIEKVADQQTAYIQFAKNEVAIKQAQFSAIEKKRLTYEILKNKLIKSNMALANKREQSIADELSVRRKGY